MSFFRRVIEDCIQVIASHGIKSKVATYNIIMASISTSNRIPLNEGIELWLGYKDMIEEISDKYPGRNVLSNANFVLDVVAYFRQHSYCVYELTARNFIIGLKAGKCTCQCFAEYIIAAAEEVGRNEIVPQHYLGHVNVGIFDSTKVQTYPCRDDINNIEFGETFKRNFMNVGCILSSDTAYPIKVVIDASVSDNGDPIIRTTPEYTFPDSEPLVHPQYGDYSEWNTLSLLLSHAK